MSSDDVTRSWLSSSMMEDMPTTLGRVEVSPIKLRQHAFVGTRFMIKRQTSNVFPWVSVACSPYVMKFTAMHESTHPPSNEP